MGATDKGIPYVEPDDLIAGWPAADKLQAETIDGLLGDNAQDLADFEATLDGGDAGQVLTKVSNADGAYDWMNPTGGGDGTPPDLNNLGSVVSGEADNQLQLSDNEGTQDPPLLYVPPVWIDADVPANLVDLPTTGQPLAFYGTDRPDGSGNGPEINAPNGSTYQFVGSRDELGAAPIMGARRWIKIETQWQVAHAYFRVYDTPRGLEIRMNQGTTQVTLSLMARTLTNNSTAGLLTTDERMWAGMGGGGTGTVTQVVTTGTPLFGTLQIAGEGIKYHGPDLPSSTSTIGSFVSFRAGNKWPNADLPGWSDATPLHELRELIEEIEAEGESHPQWDTLQQLREELANLTGTKPGDVS